VTKQPWNHWIAAAQARYVLCGMDEEAAKAAALSLWYDCGHVTAITAEQAVDQDLAEAGDLEK
jgi:hypothetical protein